MPRSRLTLAAGIACLAAAGALLASDVYLRAKAAAASVLIEHAWKRHRDDGRPHPPWSWADMHPIAVLRAGGERRVVLSGAGGESLAFGIGHVSGTAAPNEPGNCVLAGHRGTTMAWLGATAAGDRLTLETRDGATTYRVTGARVVDRHDTRVLAPQDASVLTLITCYPLNALVPGDRRLVVTAVPAKADYRSSR